MGYAIDVNQSNFEQEIIKVSYEKPVLIDFYATWCGPCQILKPILEKLVKEYDFILAKIDIDQNPELASEFEKKVLHKRSLTSLTGLQTQSIFKKIKSNEISYSHRLREPICWNYIPETINIE